MVANLVRLVSLSNILRFRLIEEFVEKDSAAPALTFQLNLLKDIYGQDSARLKTAETSRYFECGNCGRQIAGGRFALHISKCLQRGGR